ncbi:MAG: hypothetical protein ACP5QG_05835 [candidate division WOR-3 bacterium]
MDMRQVFLLLMMIAASAGFAFATTWFPEEITCPPAGQQPVFHQELRHLHIPVALQVSAYLLAKDRCFCPLVMQEVQAHDIFLGF